MILRLAVPLFVAAVTADLLSKEWATRHAEDLVYNGKPSQLPLRLLMSVIAIVVAFGLSRAAAGRGLGRQWGVYVGCTLLVAGVLSNGISPLLWSRGVPDFVGLGSSVWNLADFEIAIGLTGGLCSVAVSALIVTTRERLVAR